MSKGKISLCLNAINLFLLGKFLMNFLSNKIDNATLILFFYIERGRVYVFGNNEWGQLGLGHTKSSNKPSFIKGI